jgi:hypothetical protein
MAKSEQRGTEEQFNIIVKLLADNARAVDERRLNNNRYSDEIDKILANNAWGKEAFYKELGLRTASLGLSMRSVKKSKEPKSIKK